MNALNGNRCCSPVAVAEYSIFCTFCRADCKNIMNVYIVVWRYFTASSRFRGYFNWLHHCRCVNEMHHSSISGHSMQMSAQKNSSSETSRIACCAVSDERVASSADTFSRHSFGWWMFHINNSSKHNRLFSLCRRFGLCQRPSSEEASDRDQNVNKVKIMFWWIFNVKLPIQRYTSFVQHGLLHYQTE